MEWKAIQVNNPIAIFRLGTVLVSGLGTLEFTLFMLKESPYDCNKKE